MQKSLDAEPKIFALIIGTEILNRRRVDAHFDFVSTLLEEYGRKLSGSFIIEDDPALIVKTIRFIASLPNSIIFSFGGIGSTPDDYTRKCSAIALRDGNLYRHQEAEAIIKEKLGSKISVHSLNMADLPKGSNLIENPFNGMPAFSLDERYFFVPGFPEMSHPMLTNIAKKLFQEKRSYYRHSLTAKCRESELINVMEQMPQGVDFSSLPKWHDDAWVVTISVASYDKAIAKESFALYIQHLESKDIGFTLTDGL